MSRRVRHPIAEYARNPRRLSESAIRPPLWSSGRGKADLGPYVWSVARQWCNWVRKDRLNRSRSAAGCRRRQLDGDRSGRGHAVRRSARRRPRRIRPPPALVFHFALHDHDALPGRAGDRGRSGVGAKVSAVVNRQRSSPISANILAPVSVSHAGDAGENHGVGVLGEDLFRCLSEVIGGRRKGARGNNVVKAASATTRSCLVRQHHRVLAVTLRPGNARARIPPPTISTS